MDQTSTQSEVARIEDFLRDLPEEYGTPIALMREHLGEARFYLLGSMPSEFQLSLQLAQALLPEIENRDLRSRIGAFIRQLQAETAQPATLKS